MKLLCIMFMEKKKSKKLVDILEGNGYLINRTLHKDYNNMLSMFDKLELKKLDFL